MGAAPARWRLRMVLRVVLLLLLLLLRSQLPSAFSRCCKSRRSRVHGRCFPVQPKAFTPSSSPVRPKIASLARVPPPAAGWRVRQAHALGKWW